MNLIGPQYAKYRIAVEAWGLKNCTQKEEWFSDTVTAVVVPPYIDGAEVVKRSWKRYNMSLGLGLNKVAGKVFRIGHLGNLNEVMLISQTPISIIFMDITATDTLFWFAFWVEFGYSILLEHRLDFLQ